MNEEQYRARAKAEDRLRFRRLVPSENHCEPPGESDFQQSEWFLREMGDILCMQCRKREGRRSTGYEHDYQPGPGARGARWPNRR